MSKCTLAPCVIIIGCDYSNINNAVKYTCTQRWSRLDMFNQRGQQKTNLQTGELRFEVSQQQANSSWYLGHQVFLPAFTMFLTKRKTSPTFCRLEIQKSRIHVQLLHNTALYLSLLILPFLFHLAESLQHPAKVSNTKVKTDLFIVLLWCAEKQFPELRINFSFFFWWELFFSGDNNSEKTRPECYVLWEFAAMYI